MVTEYFKKIGWKRILVMLLGNVFLGMGIAIFKLSGLGNDAFNAMVMALSDCVGIEYANFFVVLSIVLFAVEFLTGRHYIGIGTIVNTFFLGYIVTFFYNICLAVFSAPETFVLQFIVMFAGVIVVSFGISMYQTPDAGVAAYDSLSLILVERFPKFPYFWSRILTDGLCALIAYLAGGLVGLGTLFAAFGFGPFIHFFNEHFTKKILKQ